MKKLLFLVLASMFLAMSAFGSADGIIGNLQEEGQGALSFLKIIMIIVVFVIFFGSPAGGYFLGSKISKKVLKNEQEEDAGWKIMGFGAMGAMAGIYVAYLALGFWGSMINPASNGEVDFLKGVWYLMSRIFADLGTIASSGAGV